MPSRRGLQAYQFHQARNAQTAQPTNAAAAICRQRACVSSEACPAAAQRTNMAIAATANSGIAARIEFGDTSLFYHHGHKRKIASIDGVLVY